MDTPKEQVMNGHDKLSQGSTDTLESKGQPELSSQHGKRKLEEANLRSIDARDDKRRKGTAPIKKEFLLHLNNDDDVINTHADAADDDAAEAYHHKDRASSGNNAKRREKNQGQNKARKFGSSRDEIGLCATRAHSSEFSPRECTFGENCKFEHRLRVYLRDYKREDLKTFDALCPVWDARGSCSAGWKCRFVASHSREVEDDQGRKELILIEDEERKDKYKSTGCNEDEGVANSVDVKDRISLTKKKFGTPKANAYLEWLDKEPKAREITDQKVTHIETLSAGSEFIQDVSQKMETSISPRQSSNDRVHKEDNRAQFIEPPFLPSEKRRLYFGAESPVLAPLTTQGNLPFRRLCTSLGATFTYSEMAMSLPLLQGHKPEWALMKAHESEIQPPTFTSKSSVNMVHDYGYDQSRDIKFGAQIAANKPWSCVKATEVLTALLPGGLRLIDLNVGCPIDLVYREGAGSALMDSPTKLEKMLRGMNVVSNEVPITCKIRMGTRDSKPTAQKLVERLVLGDESLGYGGSSGVAAITLHGRSRQQRYTRQADWTYIANTAALIKRLNTKSDALADTVRELDLRDKPATSGGKVFFIGNGDVYSHEHYHNHITSSGVDTVMVARGALMKPWIFEEIHAGQYLDKSSSERLGYVEKFCRYGLEAWGSDEVGIGQTRRFVLEWLSFACRYVPIGLLEYLPPSIQDRAPAYKGRNELETLMGSDNYKDWIKISEMFLGPAHKDFRFEPKHKSNSYESIQAEG